MEQQSNKDEARLMEPREIDYFQVFDNAVKFFIAGMIGTALTMMTTNVQPNFMRNGIIISVVLCLSAGIWNLYKQHADRKA